MKECKTDMAHSSQQQRFLLFFLLSFTLFAANLHHNTVDAIAPVTVVMCDHTCDGPASETKSVDTEHATGEQSHTSFTNKVFLVVEGRLKEILPPIHDTLKAIKDDFNEEKDIVKLPHKVLSGFLRGKEIPSGLIKRKSYTPDDAVLLELQLVHALQDTEPKLLSRTVICNNCKNPSVMPWQDQLLMTFESRSQSRYLKYFWLNTTAVPGNQLTREGLFGIPTYNPGHGGGEQGVGSLVTTEGADARMTVVNKDLLYVACEHPMYHMSLTIVDAKNGETQGESGVVKGRDRKSERKERERERATERESEGNYLRQRLLEESDVSTGEGKKKPLAYGPRNIWPDSDGNSPQKNWSPFIYENKLHLLQTVHPLHVVTLDSNDHGENYQAKTISSTAPRTVRWQYGEVRGGTNCVQIGEQYLGFFHSRHSIPYNSLGTYVFGAYTFSTSQPFKLTGMSTFPIYIDDLHQGSWFNKRFDYVVYPTSLFVNQTENTAYVTVGYNDHTGYLLTFSLSSILNSLAAITD